MQSLTTQNGCLDPLEVVAIKLHQMSHATLFLLPGKEMFSAVVEELSHLNPLTRVKTLGRRFAGAIAALVIILLFCLALRYG